MIQIWGAKKCKYSPFLATGQYRKQRVTASSRTPAAAHIPATAAKDRPESETAKEKQSLLLKSNSFYQCVFQGFTLFPHK